MHISLTAKKLGTLLATEHVIAILATIILCFSLGFGWICLSAWLTFNFITAVTWSFGIDYKEEGLSRLSQILIFTSPFLGIALPVLILVFVIIEPIIGAMEDLSEDTKPA
jgi:hypothetical protein